ARRPPGILRSLWAIVPMAAHLAPRAAAVKDARSATPKGLVLDRREHGATIRLPGRRRHLGQEDFVSMVVEICPLLRKEAVGPPVGRCLRHAGRLEDELVEAKASQVFAVDPARNANFSLILEADETAVEEMVRIWRKKEPIHAIEPLFGRLAGAPRLDVTGLQ